MATYVAVLEYKKKYIGYWELFDIVIKHLSTDQS